MRRLLRSRRALSPVLSTVLMILVTIIGMSVLFAFFVNYAKDFQIGSGSAVRESLVIEDVWFIGDGEPAQVWVYNVGKIDLTVSAVYVNDKPASSFAAVDVAVGAREVLLLNGSFDVGATYDLRIVTLRGSAYEGRYQWEA
jgi:flagellin-like protein